MSSIAISKLIIAHRINRWHTDIKPANIIFSNGSWKIADPGFAKFVRKDLAVFDDKNLPVTPLRGGTSTYGELAHKKQRL